MGAVRGVDTGGTGDVRILGYKQTHNVKMWQFSHCWGLFGYALSRSKIVKSDNSQKRTYMSASMKAFLIYFPFMYMRQLSEISYQQKHMLFQHIKQ
jgi:hypothetical protein